MLFLGSCNDCCVPPPEPGQYLCRYWAGKTRVREWGIKVALIQVWYGSTSSNVVDMQYTSNIASRRQFGACPSWRGSILAYDTAVPSNDWSTMQTDTYSIVYPGATNQQEDVDNWEITPMFSVAPQSCAGGASSYAYRCSNQLLTTTKPHITQLAWTSQQLSSGLFTSAGIYTTCGFLFWPLDPNASMQSQHGIYQFKIYYSTVKPQGVGDVGVKKPIGVHRSRIDRNPDANCTDGTATISGSIDVEYGTLPITTTNVGKEVLQLFLDGTTTHDSTLAPDTNNTQQTSTVTAGTADVRGADPEGGYYLGFKPTTLLTGANPLTLGHQGVVSPLVTQVGYLNFRVRNWEHLRIESTWTLCYISRVDALDNVGAIVDTYYFS